MNIGYSWICHVLTSTPYLTSESYEMRDSSGVIRVANWPMSSRKGYIVCKNGCRHKVTVVGDWTIGPPGTTVSWWRPPPHISPHHNLGNWSPFLCCQGPATPLHTEGAFLRWGSVVHAIPDPPPSHHRTYGPPKAQVLRGSHTTHIWSSLLSKRQPIPPDKDYVASSPPSHCLHL